MEGEFSRKIEKRNEEGEIKPYETLNNIIKKNEWIKYNEEERRNEVYNEKIEIIDNLIQSSEEFIMLLKNSIFEKDNMERGRNKFYLIIDAVKTKSEINKEGKRTYRYNIIWMIREIGDNLENEIMLLAQHECMNENEFKILIRSIIIGLLIINEKSDVILGINDKVANLLYDFTI